MMIEPDVRPTRIKEDNYKAEQNGKDIKLSKITASKTAKEMLILAGIGILGTFIIIKKVKEII